LAPSSALTANTGPRPSRPIRGPPGYSAGISCKVLVNSAWALAGAGLGRTAYPVVKASSTLRSRTWIPQLARLRRLLRDRRPVTFRALLDA